jgi:uncharacterized protein (DUF302 family)
MIEFTTERHIETTQDYGRRVIVDASFDPTVQSAIAALEAEGIDVVSRIDVRERLQRQLAHDFRRYVLLVAAPSRIMLEALREDLAAATALLVTVAVYELADGETAVIMGEPFGAVISDQAWQAANPRLYALAVAESEQFSRALRSIRGSGGGPEISSRPCKTRGQPHITGSVAA